MSPTKNLLPQFSKCTSEILIFFDHYPSCSRSVSPTTLGLSDTDSILIHVEYESVLAHKGPTHHDVVFVLLEKSIAVVVSVFVQILTRVPSVLVSVTV